MPAQTRKTIPHHKSKLAPDYTPYHIPYAPNMNMVFFASIAPETGMYHRHIGMWISPTPKQTLSGSLGSGL